MVKNKILIVDDDADFLEAIKVVLETKGYKVSSADNIKDGLVKVGEIMPDLIIMDVMMEKMSDGFDLSRKLKKDDKFKHIPILVLTAVGDTTGFHFSAEAGDNAWLPVEDFCEKPLKPDVLIKKVEKLLAEK